MDHGYQRARFESRSDGPVQGLYPMTSFDSWASRTINPAPRYESYSDPVPDHDHSTRPYDLNSNHRFSIPRKPVPAANGEDDGAGLLDHPINPPVSRSQPGSFKDSFFRWWLTELVASLLSLGSFLSLVAILNHYDGRGLQEINLPYSLTLNGVIAAISTLIRVTLMVPVEASLSQDAWLWFSAAKQKVCKSRLADLEVSDEASRGAWGSFLFLFRARRRWLAYVGAAVTIISLAFGTFVQQLLFFENLPSTDPKLLPGNIPRSETWQSFTGNPAEDAWSIPLNMKAAIYNGMLTENISPVTASCPTGNCTWPVTPSMAVCGACSESKYEKSCNATICNYTLPSGNVATLANFSETGEGTGFYVNNSQGAIYNSSKYDRFYLANFDVLGAPYNTFSEGWPNSETISQECALWMCVQAYEVKTLSSNQVQLVVHNFSGPVNSSFPGGWTGADNFTFPPLPSEMHARASVNYTVNIDAYMIFTIYLAPFFNGTIFLNLESQKPTNDYVQAIWNGTENLDAWIKNLALSMTNVVRTTIPMTDELYSGTGLQLGVRVRWEWLVLPAAMVGLSLFFLIATIIRTVRSPVKAWKGSPLAVLFLDIDQEIRTRASNHLNDFKGIERSVGGTKVVIEKHPEGKWILKGIS